MVSKSTVAAEKLQAQVAAKARVAVKARQEPPTAAAAPSPRRVVVAPCGLRVHPQAARSSRSKEYRPRKATAPIPVRAAKRLGQLVTTVMVRNIPNRFMEVNIHQLITTFPAVLVLVGEVGDEPEVPRGDGELRGMEGASCWV